MIEKAKQIAKGVGYAAAFMAIGSVWGIVHENTRLTSDAYMEAACAAYRAPPVFEQKTTVKKKTPPPVLDSDGIKLKGKP